MELITELSSVLDKLNGKDREFASSLITSVKRYGGAATEKQAYWMRQLIKRATTQEKPKVTANVGGILALFDHAKQNLKSPQVRASAEGLKLAIRPAKEGSRNPGCLYVKTQGGGYLGKITPNGVFQAGVDLSGPAADAVTASLNAVAANPAEAARRYAIETGACAFCGKELTDPRSVTVGYGPDCASHYNLPWGAQ